MHPKDTESAETAQQAHARHHNLYLLPRPSEDERDPLRWPRALKLAALGATAFFNFTANFAGSGLSVAAPVLEAQFHRSASDINSLLTFNFLFLGLGNMLWVSIGVKYGNRASLLLATAILFAILIWSAKETTFQGLLAARCLSGFASAAGESIVPRIVSDIFFLHERATMMSIYTILITSATALGPLLASFIIQYSSGGWVTYMWLCAALAGANLVAIFLLYPESNFHRPGGMVNEASDPIIEVECTESDKTEVVHSEFSPRDVVQVVEKPWMDIWKTTVTVDHNSSFFRACMRPFYMLVHPSVWFVIFLYGTSLASQIILIFAFPNLLMAPPYLFSGIGVGLMQIAAIVGFALGCFTGGYLADVITAAVIRRQNGKVYPEQRLISLIPGCAIGPAGCILIAVACSEKLHWVAIAFGFGMVSYATIYGPNIAITYVAECYPNFAAESLVSINVSKNLVAFLFLYTAVDWVASRGWLEVYMIMFMLTTLSMLAALPFYFFRKA